MKTKGLGQRGEDLSCTYLQDLGYKIIARNFRNIFGEMDIIAQDGQCLCFIEVKTRSSLKCGQGFESVHRIKQQKLARLALSFLKWKYHSTDVQARFDVISLDYTNRPTPSIIHLKNAFDLSDLLH